MKVALTMAFVVVLYYVSVGQQKKDIGIKKIDFGIKTGLNASVFSSAMGFGSTSSFRSGFHVGGFARRKLTKSISMKTELYFSSQGEKDEYKEMPSGTTIGSTITKINYINLPIMLQFGNKLNFHAGMQVGFLLSAVEKGEYRGAPYYTNLKDETKPIDYSYVLGIGYDTNHLTFGARVNMGLTEIFDFSNTFLYPSKTHKVMHFYVGYIF